MLVVPELKLSRPDTPLSPDFTVLTVTEPLDVDEPVPLLKATAPPEFDVPSPAGCTFPGSCDHEVLLLISMAPPLAAVPLRAKPPVIATKPPAVLVAVVSPEVTLTLPPSRVLPGWMCTRMSPPLPAVALPVPTAMRPLVPALAVPELKVKCPLTPLSPALGVLSIASPLDVAVP